MQNTLTRSQHTVDGIFGSFLFEDDVAPFMVTLEHAYDEGGAYVPKLQDGTYTCRRGQHQLHSGPIETFEVLDVPGHSGILCCHPGNFNEDSAGCVLAGMAISIDDHGHQYITHSKATFDAYMKRLEGIDEFTLVVVTAPKED